MGEKIGKGWGVKTGFKMQASWGVPVPVGAGNLILIEQETIKPGYSRIEDESLNGRAGIRALDAGNSSFRGKIIAPLRYWNMLQAMIKMAMGTRSLPVQKSGVVYADNFKLADSLEGLCGTLVIDKGVSIWEYDSVKVNVLEISAESSLQGERIRVSIDLIARNLNRESEVNTPTQIANLSLLDAQYPAGYLLSSQLKIRMNYASDDALSDLDLISVKKFVLKLDNNLSADLYQFGDGGLISEPLRAEKRKVTLKLQLGFYRTKGNEDLWMDAYERNIPLKADLKFSGSEIIPGYYNQFNIYFPELYIIGAEREVRGAGLILSPLEMVAAMPKTAPAGMTAGCDLLTSDVLEEFRITVQNRQSADLIG